MSDTLIPRLWVWWDPDKNIFRCNRITRRSILVLITAYFLCLEQTNAQAYNKTIPIENYLLDVKIWTQNDGIPHWHLNGLFQDSRGFVWGDWKGSFTRFDGQQFTEIYHQKEPLYQFINTYFAEDIHQNIWKTNPRNPGGLIDIYSPSENRFYTLREYLGADAGQIEAGHRDLCIYSIAGNVYILFYRTGELWRYDGALSQVSKGIKDANFDYSYTYIAPAGDHQEWIIQESDGVRLIDSSGQVIKEYPTLCHPEYQFTLTQNLDLQYFTSPKQVHTLSASSTREFSQIANTTPHSLNIHYFDRFFYKRYNPTTAKDPFFVMDDRILKFYDGQKLILSDVYKFISEKLPNLEVELRTPLSGAYGLYPPILLDDRSLLISLKGGNLMQLEVSPRYFKTLLKERSIRSLEIRKDTLYIALNYAELLQMDLREKKEQIVHSARPFIITLLARKDGLWYGDSDNSIGKISYSSHFLEKITDAPSTLLHSEVRAIKFSQDSTILFGSQIGLYEYNLRTKSLRTFFNDRSVYVLFEDQAGTYWAGTSKGLYHLSDQKNYLDTLPGGEATTVAHIYEQSPDTFWLATHHGLLRWNPTSGQYKLFTKEDGLSDEILHAIYSDHHGRLWISSNSGIMSFDLKANKVTGYFVEDGIANNEQNMLAHAQDSTGELFFGSISGISIFHPDSIPMKQTSLDYDLVMDQVSLYGNNGTLLQQPKISLAADTLYKLPRAVRQLAFNLAIPHFRQGKIVIDWRLPDQNLEWRPLSSDNQLFLLQIPYGNFQVQFRVRSLNSDEILATYRTNFYNYYPVYYHTHFWGLVILGAIGLIILINIWRFRSINARNQELADEVKKRTEELQIQNQTILEQNKQLEQIDHAKTQLFNDISHELRTPLNIIQLSAEILGYPDTPNPEKQVNKIKKQVENMTRMIEEIIELNYLDIGEVNVAADPVEWNSFLLETFSMFQGLAEQKNQEYQLNISSETQTYLVIDTKKTKHILNNIIGNAVKYTPENGRIQVSCDVQEKEVVVKVTDTGPGISPEEQENIFKRYYQGEHSMSVPQKGFGLGLALSHEYAQLMKGRIWVESTPGKGSSFFFAFPRVEASEVLLPDNQPAAYSLEEPSPANTTPNNIPLPNTKILVVEDNPELSQMLFEILSEDYQVRLCGNGQEAFEVLREHPTDFSLIVSDIMMPISDGYSLLIQTRRHPQLGFIPFLFLSALNSDEDKLKGYRLGVDAYISKPFEIIELKTRIKNLLTNQQLRQEFLSTRQNPGPGSEAKKESSVGDSYNEAWIKSLDEIVRKNLSNPDYKVSDMANQLHLAERTLRNYIKAYTGLTPKIYLQQARLDQAQLYINNRKYKTVSEVCYAVGFKDVRYFSKVFKQEFGKLPSDYF